MRVRAPKSGVTGTVKFRHILELLAEFFEKREMADLEYLIRMEGIDLEEVKRIFSHYGLEERFEQLVS